MTPDPTAPGNPESFVFKLKSRHELRVLDSDQRLGVLAPGPGGAELDTVPGSEDLLGLGGELIVHLVRAEGGAGAVHPEGVSVGNVPEPGAHLTHPAKTLSVKVLEDAEQDIRRKIIQAETVVIHVAEVSDRVELSQGGPEAGGRYCGSMLGAGVTEGEDIDKDREREILDTDWGVTVLLLSDQLETLGDLNKVQSRHLDGLVRSN